MMPLAMSASRNSESSSRLRPGMEGQSKEEIAKGGKD